MHKYKLLPYWDYIFEGFNSLEYYEKHLSEIPLERGVYIILCSKGMQPIFNEKSCAGSFRERKPDVSIKLLMSNWVQGTEVLFIGQAGRKMKSMTLRKKIKRLICYGHGKNVAHFQGRYIWQLVDPFKLLLAWSSFKDNEEIPTNYSLIESFLNLHNSDPFANLAWNTKNLSYTKNNDFDDFFIYS
jgi:hypothetical protein